MIRFKPEDKPTLNPQKDWKGFPSDPIELLLLSHIDGKHTVQELTGFCARTLDQLVAVLDKLAAIGIIASPRPDRPPLASDSSRPPTAPIKAASAPRESEGTGGEATLVDHRLLRQLSEIDTSVLSENVDLDSRRKEEVLLLFHSLTRLTPFQLFGIPGDATDRDVKRSYQRLSMRFHPDRYYGKNLGSFKPMMEKIFRVISESLELISTEENRQRLATVYPEAFAVGSDVNSQPDIENSDPGPSDSILEEAPESHSDQAPPRRPHRRVGLRNQIANVLSRANSNSIVSGDSDESDDGPDELILPPVGGYRAAPARMDPMHRAAQERAQRVLVHLAEGKRALEAKNYSNAASHLKTVLSLDPRHEEATTLYQEADGKNRETMGASYAARARMEEEMRDLQRASELWSMAAELSPTPEILTGAANCFSRIRNHSKAREYAQRVVQVSGKPEATLLLAQVYINAGMGLRAQSTLKELLEKYPSLPEAQRMLREAQKM